MVNNDYTKTIAYKLCIQNKYEAFEKSEQVFKSGYIL